ncbi:MAG: FHA domain-containing protein [Burkholderiaceae bacterium]|nr:FHA domain-containing protein [Burkholderiaceae bacterium]
MPDLVISNDGVEMQQVHLRAGRTSLGRRVHNDIVLTDLSVSGLHCEFEMLGPSEVWVTDVGSTNGTFIGGQRIRRQLLRDQDVLFIGIYNVQYLGERLTAEAGQTSPMKLEALGAAGTAGAMQARLKVLAGPAAGREVPLVKTVTTFGTPATAVVAITHRRNGYYIAVTDGAREPALLNGEPLSAEARALADEDVVQLGDTRIKFMLG